MKSISLPQEDSQINMSEISSPTSTRVDEIGASIYEKKSSKSSGNLGHIVKYITDSIEAFIDQICQRVPSIPSTIRIFCKALYDTISKDSVVSQIGAYRLICQHIIE